MERLGAIEDSMQLKALLAICDMTVGRLEEAERVLAEISQDERTQSILGGVMVVLCGNAELALARGDVERGLILYRDAVVALKARSIPGVEVATEFTPGCCSPRPARSPRMPSIAPRTGPRCTTTCCTSSRSCWGRAGPSSTTR